MKSCLIIEDSEPIREIASALVTDLGFEVLEADGAETGLALYQESKPDVVLIDWDMAKFAAMDFFKAFAEFDAETKVPVIVCATENDPQEINVARAAGGAAWILKPFDKFEIAQCFVELGFIAEDAVKPKPKPRARRTKKAS